MPDLLVLVNKNTAKVFGPLFEEFAGALRLATAETFPDLKGDSKKVAAMMIEFTKSSNAPKIQILGIASRNPERILLLKDWKDNLKRAWQVTMQICDLDGIDKLREVLGPKDVEVWPLMPDGIWDIIEQLTHED